MDCAVALAYTFEGLEAAAQVYCANVTIGGETYPSDASAHGLAADDTVSSIE